MVGYTQEQRRAILNRLAKASGHLVAVMRMIEDDRDSQDVIMQLTAVRSALGSTEKIILKDYIEKCFKDAVDSRDPQVIEGIHESIDKFIK